MARGRANSQRRVLRPLEKSSVGDGRLVEDDTVACSNLLLVWAVRVRICAIAAWLKPFHELLTRRRVRLSCRRDVKPRVLLGGCADSGWGGGVENGQGGGETVAASAV
jgi:hypothetical protein